LNEFKRGRASTCDELRPIEAATSEIIDKVHDIVSDRRVKMRELVETSISHGTVISILHEQLGTKKLSARWVPRLLTVVDHKRDRVTISKQCLDMFQHLDMFNPDEFLRRFINVDEILDLLLHIRDEETVKTMNFTG